MADQLRTLLRSLDEIPLPPRQEWLPRPKTGHASSRALIAIMAVVAIAVGLSIGRVLPQLRDFVSQRPAASGAPATPVPFSLRAGAVDPIAAASQPAQRHYEHVRLAAGAPLVSIEFVDGLPQSITVLDEETGADLYHISSRFGPAHPTLDQGFLQVFVAALHGDESEQLVVAYGDCQPSCLGASQILVVAMNAEHRVVIEQLRLDSLKNAVADVRAGALWVWQEDGTLRRFEWDASRQGFVEPRPR